MLKGTNEPSVCLNVEFSILIQFPEAGNIEISMPLWLLLRHVC